MATDKDKYKKDKKLKKADHDKLKQYLKDKGFKDADVDTSVGIDEDVYNREQVAANLIELMKLSPKAT